MTTSHASTAAERRLRHALLGDILGEQAADMAELADVAPAGSARLFAAAGVLRNGVTAGADYAVHPFDRATAEVRSLVAARALGCPAGAMPAADGHAPELMHALAGALELEAPSPELAATLVAAGDLAASSPRPVFVDAPLPDLLTLWADRELRGFLQRTRPLAFEPLGGPAVLHRAARFSPAVCGPYLSNMPRLVRDAAGLFGLLARAAPDWTNEPGTALLLAIGHPSLLHEVVDRAADLGWRAFAQSLLAVAERGALIDDAVLHAVRDGALDTADRALAERVQALVVRRDPARAVEWIVLAEVQGSHHAVAAEASLTRAQALAPDDRGTAERLGALRGGTFDRFEATGGFGSEPARRRGRLAREHARRAAAVAPLRSPA